MRKRLGLIAGSGRLPFEVLEAALERGLEVTTIALEGNTDPALARTSAGPLEWIAPGELGKLIGLLQRAGADHAILAGAVSRRELLRDPARLRPDARALALLGSLRERGDDAILRAVAQELEREGIPVVDSTLHLGGRLTPEGPLDGGGEPSPELARDLRLGLRVARALGAQDVGQTVVVKDGNVLAVEAAEGTDAALRRGAELGGAGVAVVKASKPGQDLRFDVPAVGVRTFELAREQRVAGFGLEAGRTLILERARALETARAGSIRVVGLAVEST